MCIKRGKKKIKDDNQSRAQQVADEKKREHTNQLVATVRKEERRFMATLARNSCR